MEIDKSVFFNFMHYEYGEAFFGSHKGMRFRLARDATLMATVWPEPYAYGVTDKELMTSEHFEVSEEGFEAAIEWINKQYLDRKEEWNKVL